MTHDELVDRVAFAILHPEEEATHKILGEFTKDFRSSIGAKSTFPQYDVGYDWATKLHAQAEAAIAAVRRADLE